MNTKFKISGFADEAVKDFEEQLKTFNKLEIEYIELRFISGKNFADLNEEEFLQVKNLLKKYNIKVSSIGSPIGKIKLSDDIDAHVALAKKVISRAKELDFEFVRIFSFYARENSDFDESDLEVITKILKDLTDYAEPQNVTLCLENEHAVFGESPENALRLLKNFDGRLKCVFDMGNFLLDDHDPLYAYKLLKDYIGYFHIKDAKLSKALVLPGTGDAKIYEILNDYSKNHSDIFVSLEPHIAIFSGLDALTDRGISSGETFTDELSAFTAATASLRKTLNKIEE